MLPVAMEGALKLKEISYIHAEAYAAGELKHGPLALIDDDMPVVAVAPNNGLLSKLNSNLREVSARGARLYVFSDSEVDMGRGADLTTISVPPVEDLAAPIVYTVPLQLLAYHVAVLKGADVDQPRNPSRHGGVSYRRSARVFSAFSTSGQQGCISLNFSWAASAPIRTRLTRRRLPAPRPGATGAGRSRSFPGGGSIPCPPRQRLSSLG